LFRNHGGEAQISPDVAAEDFITLHKLLSDLFDTQNDFKKPKIFGTDNAKGNFSNF
jgi:hypothetical protein